jgi:hypothetical protein
MPGFLRSLPFLAQLLIGNYYAKNIHPRTGSDLACRMLEYAAERISFVLSQCMQRVYKD